MRYITLMVLAVLVVIASCSLLSDQDNFQHKPYSFDIDEKVIHEGLLRIYLPEEVPKNLAIQNPYGEWFVLQETEESIEIMPQSEFESIKIMEFQIEKLKGVTWRESNRVTELVFQSPGAYLVYFADNLETEPDNTFSLQKTVQFKK